MEYPTLKRPKRKLCYLTNKESSSKKWTEPLTLEEIDKLFDDLDPPSNGNDDLLPPHTLLQTFDVEPNQCERVASPVPHEGHRIDKFLRCQMGPKVDALRPVTSSSPKLDIDLDIPFKAHMPVKTSSPIEVNVVVKELVNAKRISPILFANEDEEKEEAKAEPLLIQEPQCNEHGTEENDDSELESPPSKVVFIKPKMSSHQNQVEESCKESHPVKEKQIPKKPQTSNLDGKNKKPREENAEPLVSAERQEPELAKLSEIVHSQPLVESTSVGKDMTSFLKKLRDAAQPKPTCSRKSLTPVKAPTLPAELEDDFLILEDDNLLWFSIPSKTATAKKQRQGRTSSTDKDSSTDKGTTDGPLETAQKTQESEQPKNKLGSQTLPQKTTKKKKVGEKKIQEAEPGNDMDELSTPEDLPAGDLMVEEKPNKRKQLRKVTSKESDKEEEQQKDGASGDTYKEKTSQKTEKKAQQPSDMKRPASIKDGNKNAKTSRAKSLKVGRKVMQGPDVVKQTMKDEAEKRRSQSSEEHDAEDLGSLSDEEIMNSKPQTKKAVADKKPKRNKIPVVSEGTLSEGTSSEDGPLLGKRKRKSPEQWWLDQQDSEETKVTDNQRTLKKSKQPKPEPSAAVQSPVKSKKERASKKRNQTPPAPSSSPNTNKAKGKKTKGNKNQKEDARPDEVFQGVEAEQCEEQLQQEEEEQEDEEVDHDQSSPLVHSQRDHSSNLGDKVFQRVYHNASAKKQSTLAPVSPGGLRDQLSAADSKRRRRKPTGSWWKLNDECEDVESVSSQQQGPKPRKERKVVSKRSGSSQLGTPKNGKEAVPSKPQGGAPVCLLEVKPTSAPKTVKRSLATFKDIFTSVTETPAVVTRREPCQRNKRKAAARPAEEVPAAVCTIFSERTDGDILSMDAVEPGSPHTSPPNHKMPQNSNCSSGNRLKLLRSGPSSMIDLKDYEEEDDDDNSILTPPSSHAALSVSDLCAPPLKPLVLQLKDKTNLTEWFRSLWSVPADKGPEVTPDQFDWYFYQGRAIGFLVDLNCASFCNGRILLGSYMKKPLWVDHSATTVFNLLTSSVSVTIDGKESSFNPGQSFMVECGHAYNIQNITAQPAVLYFTRMFAESSD